MVNMDAGCDEMDLQVLANLFDGFKYDFMIQTMDVDQEAIELRNKIEQLKKHLNVLSTGKVTPALSENGDWENESRDESRDESREASTRELSRTLSTPPSFGGSSRFDEKTSKEDRTGLSMPRPPLDPPFRKGFPTAREKSKLRGIHSLWGVDHGDVKTWQEELIEDYQVLQNEANERSSRIEERVAKLRTLAKIKYAKEQ